ncbi:NACHT domain-containing protein [Streptomyces sp. XM4193]|uniref:NACHT domain-containing protein n=1 Tax=Streptomyces sp. XM4193 TaxID=2929782 RepID=UPI001FF96B4B|nr:NACHT domain-containing protein [Streptomyces sp. XM4193]MCK1798340.1 NACHT domain-containing protein [Streptomyces sp. XM4193]
MEPANIGARIASSAVMPLIKKLFLPGGRGAGLVDKPVRMEHLVSFKGEKRTLTDKDLRKLAEELVGRAVSSMGAHDRLHEYEFRAVVNAVSHSLRRVGDLDMDDVQIVRLGYRSLAAHLKGKSDAATNGLSADAVLLHASILETCCLHILHFFTQRSTFIARTLVEQSQQLDELTRKIDQLIARTPSPADAPFEQRYTRYVAKKYRELTIFGLDLSDSPDRWPLDVAYLSLNATADSTSAVPLHLPAEQALASNDRVLLRGVAGSGKTTLVQWLAVSAAKKKMQESSLYLHGLVPFVLPLRTLTREGKGLPTPAEFLSAIRCPLSGSEPTGWADRVLSSERGLLLVDGIDEVPEDERNGARDWLQDLIAAFPNNRWLVTSRPSAVRGEWLSADGFTELDLVPMSRDDVASFINRWHEAAGASDTYTRSLLKAVWGKQDLGRLATNPLMCGLICALHRDRRGYLPDGRKELYDAALSMLLSRRDRERGIQKPGVIRIGEAHQIQLLQKLAYWMIRNGRSEMSRVNAVELVALALPGMPQVADQANAERVYRHLLVRSGVIREPSTETVDFVHRSFQDYLGARAAVEGIDFGLLAKNAHLDQWEDVIRMSVAHARPKERADFLETLIDFGDQRAGDAQRLHLLAAACLEHATELDPAIRSAVQQRAAALIPPRSREQARALSEVGPFVLELLPGPQGLSDDEAFYTVVCAVRIGTDAAISVLSQYRHLFDMRVKTELVHAWSRFDTRRYAEAVISHLNGDDLYFPVSNAEELHALGQLGGRSHVQAAGTFSMDDFNRAGDAKLLTHLRLSPERGDTLDWIAGLRRLRTVVLDSAYSQVDVSPLAKSKSLRAIRIQHGLTLVGADLLPSHVRIVSDELDA